MNNILNKRILANNVTVSNDTRVTGLNNNDMIIGPSGSGKTGGYVIPNMLSCNASMITADTKCILYNKYANILRKKGYDVYLIDFVNPEYSCSYNPLDYIRYDKKLGRYREQDIITVSEALIPNSHGDEPYWDNSARQLVSCLTAFVLEALDPDEHNMLSVLELLRILIGCSSNGIEFLEDWSIKHPDGMAAKTYGLMKGCMTSERTWACIIHAAAVALNIFDFSEMRQMLCSQNNKFRIESLGKKKSVLFINVSDTDRSFDGVINIFYTQALQALCASADNNPSNDYRLDVPVRIILDDFAANAKIKDFDKIISVIRSRDISVSIILQSLTQLQSMYSHADSMTIVNNCDHLLYLGGSDLDTAQIIAEKSCKPVNDILCMDIRKMYLITRGKKGILTDKVKPYSFVCDEEDEKHGYALEQVVDDLPFFEEVPF